MDGFPRLWANDRHLGPRQAFLSPKSYHTLFSGHTEASLNLTGRKLHELEATLRHLLTLRRELFGKDTCLHRSLAPSEADVGLGLADELRLSLERLSYVKEILSLGEKFESSPWSVFSPLQT